MWVLNLTIRFDVNWKLKLFFCIFQYFDDKKALLSAASLGIFPLFYFFSFLYYTDVGSTFMVMLMYSLHLDGNDWFASFIGALSVLFRQTNIVWVFFVAGQSAGPILIQKGVWVNEL